MYTQLGFAINDIIAAGSDTLAGVFEKLTGKTGAANAFLSLVNAHYPIGFTYNPAGDDIFPVSNLVKLDSPASVTCGYSETVQVFIDSPAMAEVHIAIQSDDPSVVQAPATVTIKVGETSASVAFTAPPVAGPFTP